MSFFSLRTIRSRLIAGFSLLVGLLVVAGMVGHLSIGAFAAEIASVVTKVQRETALSALLNTSITRELAASARYLDLGAGTDREAFRAAGWTAHGALRDLNNSDGLTSTELGLISTIGEQLSTLEVGLTQAQLLRDLGRVDASSASADTVHPLEATLVRDVARLSEMRAKQVAISVTSLQETAAQRKRVLLAVIIGAVLLGIVTFVGTVQRISAPLALLVAHAKALSQGRLDIRTETELPGEFQALADAMNTTAASLSRVATVAGNTSVDVATSAHQLTSAADQISVAAAQTATAMSDVTEGAEMQVSALRDADRALQSVRDRAHEVRAGADEVSDLSAEIERVARAKRAEIARARGLLAEIRQSVDRATGEVRELTTTAEGINRFVGIVSRIAEQTNLLSLNAAIEAARAGVAGRGFAVVADEVRKLADQAQQAADDVVQLTAVVTRRVVTTTAAMETGASRVAEIESVSEGIDVALETISTSAETTRAAAEGLGAAAGANVAAVNDAAASISAAARAAEGHAAAAQQVSAVAMKTLRAWPRAMVRRGCNAPRKVA